MMVPSSLFPKFQQGPCHKYLILSHPLDDRQESFTNPDTKQTLKSRQVTDTTSSWSKEGSDMPIRKEKSEIRSQKT